MPTVPRAQFRRFMPAIQVLLAATQRDRSGIRAARSTSCARWVGDIPAVQGFRQLTRHVGSPSKDAVAIICASPTARSARSSCPTPRPVGRSWEQTSTEQEFDHHGKEDCCIIAGTQGSLPVPTMRVSATRRKPPAGNRSARGARLPEVDPLTRQLAHFAGGPR